jgi:hemerythrin superfamily protein
MWNNGRCMPATSGAPQSLADKVATQHRLIESLFRGFDSALSSGDGEAVHARLGGLAEALKAHFTLEEDHYFPARRKASPEAAEGLDELTREHTQMLGALETITRQLEADAPGRAADTFRGLVAHFSEHEDREQQLLGS